MSVIKHGSNHSGPQNSTDIKNVARNRTLDILFAAIDKSECVRLKNGQIRCLVCPSQPVFSDPKGFVAHRYGKKHRMGQGRQRGPYNLTEKGSSQGSNSMNLKDKNKKRIALLQYTNQVKENILNESYNNPHTSLSKETEVLNTTSRDFLEPQRSLYLSPQTNSRFDLLQAGALSLSTSLTKTMTQSIQEIYPNQMNSNPTLQTSIGSSREYELKMIQKGYIKDSSGGWYKDENVEFDSDDVDYIPPDS